MSVYPSDKAWAATKPLGAVTKENMLEIIKTWTMGGFRDWKRVESNIKFVPLYHPSNRHRSDYSAAEYTLHCFRNTKQDIKWFFALINAAIHHGATHPNVASMATGLVITYNYEPKESFFVDICTVATLTIPLRLTRSEIVEEGKKRKRDPPGKDT